MMVGALADTLQVAEAVAAQGVMQEMADKVELLETMVKRDLEVAVAVAVMVQVELLLVAVAVG
jgi:hypothetical protein